MIINNKGDMFHFTGNTLDAGSILQQRVVIWDPSGKPLKLGEDLDQIEGPKIAGLLTNDFEYGIDADWSAMLDGKLDNLPGTNISTLAGTPLFQSGIFKRKFYKGGSYISFPLDFRLVSDQRYLPDSAQDGGIIDAPKTAAHFLASLCLPKDNAIIGGIAKIITGETSPLDAAENLKNKIVDKWQNGLEYPGSIGVSIGNYFISTDMILEKFTVKFSRETVSTYKEDFGDYETKDDVRSAIEDMNKSFQPLYADFSLTVSTRTVPSTNLNGFTNSGLMNEQPIVTVQSELTPPGL
tara:strand:+ start:9802 stop:10686 length:885 start_codon:yes stop_codon:yes gene_type:complete